jgi:hypothetical protein
MGRTKADSETVSDSGAIRSRKVRPVNPALGPGRCPFDYSFKNNEMQISGGVLLS